MDTLDFACNPDSVFLRENSPVLMLNDGLLSLPLDALQIKGRLTPISAQSNVSTGESSLNSSPHHSRRSSYFGPDELEYDIVMPCDAGEEQAATNESQLKVENATPGFNWSPLPLRKHLSEKSELDTMESEVKQVNN